MLQDTLLKEFSKTASTADLPIQHGLPRHIGRLRSRKPLLRLVSDISIFHKFTTNYEFGQSCETFRIVHVLFNLSNGGVGTTGKLLFSTTILSWKGESKEKQELLQKCLQMNISWVAEYVTIRKASKLSSNLSFVVKQIFWKPNFDKVLQFFDNSSCMKTLLHCQLLFGFQSPAKSLSIWNVNMPSFEQSPKMYRGWEQCTLCKQWR